MVVAARGRTTAAGDAARATAPGAAGAALHLVHADVTDPATLGALFQPGDVAIHLVGLSPLKRPRGGRRTYRRVHVEGTRHVVAAAVRAGAARLVYLSALGVHRGAGAAYAETKAHAERIVMHAPIPTAVVGPSLFTGEGGELARLFSLLCRLPLVPLPTLEPRFRPMEVREGAAALVDLATADELPPRVALVGRETLTMSEVAAHALAGCGTPTVKLPRWLSALVVQLVSWVKLPGAPAELAAMLAIDNAGLATTDPLIVRPMLK